ncbi:MBL fold metallo-hydrolase [Micromonospora zhanjiangensis]|uniref:MBL fold metallo-hydrolase n=1 Tax=Micromonospora zhanjiangensis TaxID=1522057 RepID=A0ABV8KX85_9ACTN
MDSELRPLAPGVYAYLQPPGGWCVSNAGLLTGAGSAALIDTTATESRARRLYDTAVATAGRSPGIVVNTHHHGDHTFGNFVFAGEATVIAHEAARTEMADKGTGLRRVWPDVGWGEISVALPDLTFTERLSLHIGDLHAELRYVGPAHTSNDVVVWLPEHGVLFAGDVLMAGATPFVLMGSLSGSLQAVAALRRLPGLHTVVCGHGPVCGPEVLDVTEGYLTWLAAVAADGVRRGWNPLEAARRADLGEFATLTEPERLVANLHRAYAEERGAPRGIHLPSAPAFDEMVAYNGGRPLTCRA